MADFDHYTQEVAESYDGWFDMPLGRQADRLEKALIYRLAQPRAGERALDVGSGTGHFCIDLASRGLDVVGIDPSPHMLAIARQKSAAVVWRQGRGEALSFDSDSFDLVLSVAALEFMRQPEVALREMYRLVRPGGRLVVATLNSESAWGRFYVRQARQQGTIFQYAQLYAPRRFVAALRELAAGRRRVRWSSAVFFGPTGRGMRWAGPLEWFGQRLTRKRGALLVGRVDK